jgi:Fe-S cluster assembly ATP-binding protein
LIAPITGDHGPAGYVLLGSPLDPGGVLHRLLLTLLVNTAIMTLGFYAALFFQARRLTADDLAPLAPEERAARGIFLALQYPVEIPGVTTMTFLKTALNAQRRARGESEFDAVSVLRLVREKAAKLKVPEDMLKRALNVGFSGGEKKRLEVLQMALFEPALAILDETDSGLDIDALKIVAEGVNALRSSERGMLVITHYQRLLNYIVPDRVHVLSKGRIVREGGKELALELEAKGYEGLAKDAA